MCNLGCPVSDHYRSIVRALTLQTRYSKALPFFFHPVSAANIFSRIKKYSVSPGGILGAKKKMFKYLYCIFSSVWPQSKQPFENIFLTEQKLKLSLGRMHTMNGQLKSASFLMSRWTSIKYQIAAMWTTSNFKERFRRFFLLTKN